MGDTTKKQINFLSHGLTVVFDSGKQIEVLQKPWLEFYLKFLETEGIDPCSCEIVMPDGSVAQVTQLDSGEYNWNILGEKARLKESFKREGTTTGIIRSSHGKS